ncbi:MAG: Asp23/Gls24 family envelope stress response protein [Anaerolineae bacterium]
MEQSTLGRIEVTPTAIASLASQAVLECYGVVGMAVKDLASGIVEILQPASHRRGVEVHLDGNDIVIDLYVVIEYGTRVAVVARNIQSVVKYTLEKALGVPVVAVNVHVQDLRVSAD